MSVNDYFQWWRQAPFACALFRDPPDRLGKTEFVAANAVFKVVTGLTQEQLALSQAEDYTIRAVYVSRNTALSYQVHSYAPEAGYLLVTLHQIPNLKTVTVPDSADLNARFDHTTLTALMLDIAQRFIGVELAQLAPLLNETLAQLGMAVAADRVYIFDYDFSNNTCSNTYEWCAEGIVPEISSLQQVPLAAIPQWVFAHQRGAEMYIPDVPSLPDGDALKQLLQPQGIKSLLTLPMLADKALLGFVGFDSVKQHHYYSEQERLLLGVFSRMLVNIKRQDRSGSAFT